MSDGEIETLRQIHEQVGSGNPPLSGVAIVVIIFALMICFGMLLTQRPR